MEIVIVALYEVFSLADMPQYSKLGTAYRQ